MTNITMKQKIRILVADDHAIVRTGLASLLARLDDIEVVGEACDGREAVTKALRLSPDVVVMDLAMPELDGTGATREILAVLPETKILILTSFGTSQDISNALSAGACGAVYKSIPNAELISSIRRVAEGKRVVSSEIQNIMRNNPPVQGLSPRQLEILESVTRGLSTKQIALQFSISRESVKTHITRIFRKIGAANRAEAITIAMKMHLLKV